MHPGHPPTDLGDPAEADPQGAAGGSCQSAPWYYGGGGSVSIDGGEGFSPGDGGGGLLGNSESTIPCQSGSCRLDPDGNFIGPVYVPSRIGFHLYCDGPMSDPNVNCKNLTLVLPSEYQFGVTGNQSAYPNDGSILSQIMNNPSLSGNWTRTLNSASDWVTAATVATTAATTGAFVGGELATTPVGDLLFEKSTGLLNANDFFRIGWSRYGKNIIDFLPAGGLVFRVVVGCPDCWIHWHLWP